MKREILLEALKDIFTEQTPAAGLVTPSQLTRERAEKVVVEMPLEQILRDVAVVAARELANGLETVALRPADYADDIRVADAMAVRLAEELSRRPYLFTRHFLDQLGMRG